MPAGTYTVTATLGMQAASDTVTVTAPPQAPLEILSLTCDEVFLQGEFGPGAYEAVCTASLSAEATNWQWSPGLGSGLESWEVDARRAGMGSRGSWCRRPGARSHTPSA